MGRIQFADSMIYSVHHIRRPHICWATDRCICFTVIKICPQELLYTYIKGYKTSHFWTVWYLANCVFFHQCKDNVASDFCSQFFPHLFPGMFSPLKQTFQGLALQTLSWDKNWDSHSLVNGYPSFYPRIALVAPSPGLRWYQKSVSSFLLKYILQAKLWTPGQDVCHTPSEKRSHSLNKNIIIQFPPETMALI